MFLVAKNMEPIIIPVNDELYSTLPIGTDAFPMDIFYDDLDNFAQGFVNWHRQKQIEISYVSEGYVKLSTLKAEEIICSGKAFIIFPDKLHSISHYDSYKAKYTTVIFSPALLTGYKNSFFHDLYYKPVLNADKDYYIFEKTKHIQQAFQNLFWIYKHYTLKNHAYFLSIQRKLQDIWIILYNNVFQSAEKTSSFSSRQDRKILKMVEYLQIHFAEKFSLSQMADFMKFSRGECCRYFKKKMKMTISEYLLEYRLKKSLELLEKTDKNITQIANSIGFNSASNYTAMFKLKLKETPSHYRKKFHS